MRTLRIISLAAVAAMAAAPCTVVEGPRILGSDLARANPVFEALDPERAVGFSPAPGVERLLRVPQLRALVAPLGLEERIDDDLCFERAIEELTAARVLEVILRELPDNATVEITDFSRRPVPAGELTFPLAGLSSPGRGDGDDALWRGKLLYDQRRSIPVWARVRVRVPRRQLIALRELERGETIAQGDVESKTAPAFPSEDAALASEAEAVGAEVRRAIAAGAQRSRELA